MEKDVPLVIAYVNDEDLRTHKGIIANPNCSTSQLMLVLKPLHEKAKIKRLIVSTYQAVSGAGIAAINELTADTKANLAGENFENKCFKKPISFNVIPQIDVFCENGYTKEEMKVANETKKFFIFRKTFRFHARLQEFRFTTDIRKPLILNLKKKFRRKKSVKF